MEPQEFELTAKGFRYYCRVIKSENETCDPIIFISGAFQTMDSWDKFVNFFHDKTTLILVDLPGVGKADILPAKYDLVFLADCIDQVLKLVSIPKVNVLSASYGSPIGYEFAKQYPHHIAHLSLVGIMREIPKDSEDSVYYTIELLKQNKMNEFANEVMKGLLCMDPNQDVNKRKVVARLFRKQLQYLPPDYVVRYIENTLRLFQHSPLNIEQSSDVPTLVFTGEHDIFTKPHYCKEIAQSFKNAVFTTIKNADHLCHMEQFEAVINLFDKFFHDERLDNLHGCNRIEYLTR